MTREGERILFVCFSLCNRCTWHVCSTYLQLRSSIFFTLRFLNVGFFLRFCWPIRDVRMKQSYRYFSSWRFSVWRMMNGTVFGVFTMYLPTFHLCFQLNDWKFSHVRRSPMRKEKFSPKERFFAQFCILDAQWNMRKVWTVKQSVDVCRLSVYLFFFVFH